jgi:hypothetical protein
MSMHEESTNDQIDTRGAEPTNKALALQTDIKQPVADTPGHEPQARSGEARPKAPKKRRVIALIVAIVVACAGIGVWAAYAFWYQNPDKVVLDAMINAATAKSFSLIGSASSSTNSNYQTAFTAKGGSKLGLSGSVNFIYKSANGTSTQFAVDGVHTASGSDYFRLTNAKTAINTFLGQPTTGNSPADTYGNIGQQLFQTMLQPTIQKIDGKWVGITPDDVKKINGTAGQNYDCIEKALTNLTTDNNKLIEVGTTYWNNKFIVIKQNLGEKAGKFGYVVGVDTDKVKQFASALKTTKFYADFSSCSDSIDPELIASSLDKKSVGQAEVWIDTWSHQLSSVHVSGAVTSDIQTTFNQPVTVTTPSDAVELSDIFSGLEQAFVSSYSSYFKSD